MSKLNIANSIFDGFNNKNGLMIFGYEWGFGKTNSRRVEKYILPKEEIEHTFANKALYYGGSTKIWPYDRNVKKWFGLWGHPLDERGLGGAFEKSIVQTNWSNSQAHVISNYEKFLSAEQIENFLYHIQEFRPELILFMGSKLLGYLNNEKVLPEFKRIVGEEIDPKRYVQKEFAGRRFRIGFQRFEWCQVVCFPHPSASRGLSDEYIKMFRPEMDQILSDYKSARGF